MAGNDMVGKHTDRNHARFTVIHWGKDGVLIQDKGAPHDIYPTITNDAEWVVQQVLRRPYLKKILDRPGKKLFYIDSMGQQDEIIVHNGKFAGFRAGPDRAKQ